MTINGEIDSADTANAKVSAVINTISLVQDDVLEVVITATAGGGTLGQGLFVILEYSEAAQ